MDYGDRQDRAEMLIKSFRSLGEAIATPLPINGRHYTGSEIANEIEQMTPMGKNTVAVAGLVIQAKSATPEFFEDKAST